MCVSNLLIWSITWHHLTTWAKKGEEGSWTKSISSRAQHVTLQKYFSRQSLVICFFPTPPTKLKLGLGTTNRQKTTNSSPPGPIKLCNQSTAVVRLCCAFYQPQQTLQKYWAKTILMRQTGILDFSSSNFDLQRHILNTGGIALMLGFWILHTREKITLQSEIMTNKMIVLSKLSHGGALASWNDEASQTL